MKPLGIVAASQSILFVSTLIFFGGSALIYSSNCVDALVAHSASDGLLLFSSYEIGGLHKFEPRLEDISAELSLIVSSLVLSTPVITLYEPN